MLFFQFFDFCNRYVVIHVLVKALNNPGRYDADEAGDRHPPDMPDHGETKYRSEGGRAKLIPSRWQGAVEWLIEFVRDNIVSYIEGCSAPVRDSYQLHAAVVEVIIHKDAEVKYSTVQN